MVWMGTARAVSATPYSGEADPVLGHCYVSADAADAPIRACFTSPHVSYVGAYEGCGCGFNSALLEWEGLASVAEARSLIEAMNDKEREEFVAQQRSREWLSALVAASLAGGAVEVYGCWSGEEELLPTRVEVVDARWLTERLAPLETRVKYVVPSPV
jgi:hypothetical protein